MRKFRYITQSAAALVGILLTTEGFPQKALAYQAPQFAFNRTIVKQQQVKQTLKTVLTELNRVKGTYFLYSDKTLDSREVNAVTNYNADTRDILETVLLNTGIEYRKVSDNTFVLLASKNRAGDGDTKAGTEASSTGSRAERYYQTITGRVTNSEGQPMAGVSIQVKGTSRGTTTSASGEFSIEANTGDVLLFSNIGYGSQEFTIGTDRTINVSLSASGGSMSEVVVTALGIQRQKKSLTYSVQKVGNADLSTVKDVNVVNSLNGKIAGITVTRSASGVGGSTRVIIRGNKSTRENQPLYVIDGVPMTNTSPVQPADVNGQSVGFVGIDGGDGISNLNPDDIESMSVLKGASAAALYGARAANGVILITTKKGKAGSTRIEFSSDLTFDAPLYKQPLQFKYGQTTTPKAGSPGSTDSWGGVVNAPNHVDDFFRTGVTSFNSLALSGGTDKSQSYFSYSFTDNKGIIPTSTFKKHNLNFHQTSRFFNDRLVADFNALYIHQATHNRPVSGLYNNPLLGLYELPRGLNFDKYKQYEVFSTLRNTAVQNFWNHNYDSAQLTSGWAQNDPNRQNPYWLLYRDPSNSNVDRVYANLALTYKINSWLNLQGRANVDKSINDIDLKSYATTDVVVTGNNGGYFSNRNIFTQLYGDLILTGTKKLNTDLGLSASIGTSITDDKRDGTNIGTKTGGDGLRYANEFTFANILPNFLQLSQVLQHQQTQAVFGTAQLNWQDKLYLDLTGRNDWNSTLAFTPSKKSGYFYYSAGLTGVISDMVNFPGAISFAKVRASYAKVGNAVSIYATNPATYTLEIQNPANFNTKGVFPGTYLRPEDNRSFEAGTEWRFLHDRLGLDFTYYQNNNFNQYLEVAAPRSSGYQTYYLNGGNIRNNGVELSVTAVPFKSKSFNWNTTINYAFNKNKIISLRNDELNVNAQSYTLTGLGNLLYASYLVEGDSYGDIYGRFFQRDANGAIVVDASGVPKKGNNAVNKLGVADIMRLGNPNPKYTFGWNNTFTISNFTVNVLIDGRVGGQVMSVTEALLDADGYSVASASARDAGGVKLSNAVTENGTKYTGTTTAKAYYQGVGKQDGISENYMYDATNIRMRELAVGYNIPVKAGWVKNLRLSLISRNVFFITRKAPFDPETSIGTANSVQGVEAFSVPTTRSIGISLKAGF